MSCDPVKGSAGVEWSSGVLFAFASLVLLAQSGCAMVSPLPAWELIKASGAAATVAVSYGPSGAKDVVHHGDAPISAVCIEYNPTAQLADLVPSLQAALRDQGVASRVYEAGTNLDECGVWLRYAATIDWDVPPMSSGFRAYLTSASLGLHRSNGQLMASGSYEIDRNFGLGKWASTRRKVSPVVKALITGFDT